MLTADDFRLVLKPGLDKILSAVERQDDEWIWTSFFRVGARWISQHLYFLMPRDRMWPPPAQPAPQTHHEDRLLPGEDLVLK